MTEVYPEPPGYAAMPGFVKARPENNDYYVEQFADDPWYPAIYSAHSNIADVVPNYNISQIKSKFGGLRFYYGLPLEEDIDWNNVPKYITDKKDRMEALRDWCDARVSYAEAWVDGYEARVREE